MKEIPIISFRSAVLEDCRIIFDWRNDPEARENFLSSRLVTWQEHTEWFQAKVSDPGTALYILLAGDKKPIGQIRIDFNEDEGIVSITIAPESRGQGYGGRGLKAVMDHVVKSKRISRLVAFVKQDNVSSRKIFLQNFFVNTGELLAEGRSFWKFERFLKKEPI